MNFDAISQNTEEVEREYHEYMVRHGGQRYREHQSRLQEEADLRREFDAKKYLTNLRDYQKEIPTCWQEELLDEYNDTQVNTAIMETCGPLTLFTYVRCLQLSLEYYEMKEMSSMYLVGAQCLSAKRKSQLNAIRRRRQ